MVAREMDTSITTSSRALRAVDFSATPGLPPGWTHQHPLQDLELLQAFAGPDRNGRQWAVGDVDGHAGLMAQALVEAAEQGAASRQHDSLVHDVAGQFRRRAVEGALDRIDDRSDGLLDRLTDLPGGRLDGLRKARHQ